ncbi:MAG TPA: GMC family oxidoreductase [Candidatus Limnocylindria bacterium]|nr:GMC family oxidoreductase [Candidatus Limnocylindria bacterium]
MTARADKDHFDAVVVGSGFGGSVMTYRLAEAGRRVLLLERGRRFPPGSFPRSPYRFRRAFWDPSEGLYGMFSIWSFDHLGAVVASGLGGGSLIYANVLLRKPAEWFAREEGGAADAEYWPVTYDELAPHYDNAERMLAPQTYPFEHEPYASTPRTKAFVDGARRLGWEPFFPPLAVTFAAPDRPPAVGDVIPDPPGRPNLHGATRTTCRLVGECDIGCNFGAKNTLDYNYLSEAIHEKALIRDLCEVRELEPRPRGGWLVRYVEHDLEREGMPFTTHRLPLREVSCDRLILSGGTLGSVYLLLRNKDRLPGLSAALGTHFSGNGDLLTLALRPRDPRSGRLLPMESGIGPAITAAVRFPDGVEDGSRRRGFYLQDAGYPDMINWLIQAVEMPGAILRYWATAVRLVRRFMKRQTDTDVGAELSRLLGDAHLSSGILPLLGMGREWPNGVMRLRDGLLDVDWTIDRSSDYFEAVRLEQRRLARALGARFRDNPMWHFGRRVITVHPLGGAPMGRKPEEGVVDARGRVFGYAGLYIADGSIMPGTVGPNPSLTIAAMSDLIAEGILSEGGRPA